MSRLFFRAFSPILFCLLIVPPPVFAETSPETIQSRLEELIASVRAEADRYTRYDVLFPPQTEMISTELRDEDTAEPVLHLLFNRFLGYRPWDDRSAEELERAILGALEGAIPAGTKLEMAIRYTNNRENYDISFQEHVIRPDQIRRRQEEREIPPPPLAAPVIERVDRPVPMPRAGLQDRHIVVGPSHGITWHEENRWQFQRARVYTIIEDLFPLSYVNDFLAPMLENAGATVWAVRERDWQTGEVIVDNDGTTRYSEFVAEGGWSTGPAPGWKGGRPAMIDQDTEPFTLGTTLRAEVDPESPATATYTPYIPHMGRFAVYLSWPHGGEYSPSVPVTVRHLGGETRFRVNQQVAGGTWILLGFFEFDQGADADMGSVVISTEGAAPAENADTTHVGIDAVRFGGGMGNIAPMDTISHFPRYSEASNYWLQYAGAPALVYKRHFNAEHFGVDYWSDIAARAEWANYLHGAPNGPNSIGRTDHRDHPGLGVPVDMYISWHTDAGFDQNGLIGTLSIYRIFGDDNDIDFPDGRSRMLNRDLTAIMQEEIIRTGRELFSSSWARRHLHERNLGEIRRPNVPSTLLELVSHHNFNDMKYGIDPRFKFHMSRAIYKSVVRFIAWSHGYDPVIQPLSPTHLSARHTGDGGVELRWRPQPDPLEPTADPTGYIVYTSRDGRSFDNGRSTAEATLSMTGVPEGESRYFRVTAVNDGGESFPTAVVGVRWMSGREPVLIVDGFDRVSPPAIVHQESTHGFDRLKDPGVPWGVDYSVVGNQYDFDPANEWINDLESPGMGGSSNNMERRSFRGNTFDHIVVHGAAFAEAGWPFDSATADAWSDGEIEGEYPLLAWIAGRQRSTPPPEGMPGNGNPDRMTTEFEVLPAAARVRLVHFIHGGGKLLISGSHIVEDLTMGPLANAAGASFAENILGAGAAIPRATNTNSVRPAAGDHAFDEVKPFWFGRDLEPPINILPTVYPVHSAETFLIDDDSTRVYMVYGDTGSSAIIGHSESILMGFPLETVLPPDRRAAIIGASLQALGLEMPLAE